jgi:hypothetical protein
MLGFFFRHYDPWVDRYFVYDDGSTDGSLDILRAHPRVEVRRFERECPHSFALSQLALQNRVWKESRRTADWVVITALDEHLVVPTAPMRAFLDDAKTRGVTAIPALGYHMVSDDFPTGDGKLCLTRPLGVPHADFNKLSLFNPSAIEETNFAPGRHTADPVGLVTYPERDELLLLHYKFLVFDRFVTRCRQLMTRLGQVDIANDWGLFYAKSEQHYRDLWEFLSLARVDTSSPHLTAWRTHPGRRWWRNEGSRIG